MNMVMVNSKELIRRRSMTFCLQAKEVDQDAMSNFLLTEKKKSGQLKQTKV